MAELDHEKLRQDLLSDLVALGEDVKKGLWRDQDREFLEQIATDIALLAKKQLAATEPAKKKKYQRAIRLLSNHVVVMAHSRLNVLEQQVSQVLLNLLEKAVSLAVQAALARVGL